VIRYIAFVWDAAFEPLAMECVRRAFLQNRHLKTAVQTPCVAILVATGASDPKPQLLGDGGVLIGTLFTKPTSSSEEESSCTRAILSPAEAQRIIATRGELLVEHYWGNYVGFLSGDVNYPMRAIRGPFARLSCLHSAVEGLRMYASDMQTLAGLQIRLHSINWAALARTFMGPEPVGSCHLNEVRELAGGTCEDASGSHSKRHTMWSASCIASEPFHAAAPAAAVALRSTARACTRAWTAEHAHVLVGLSGGLDSSITLSCVASSPSRLRVTAVTQFGSDGESDERVYARLVTRRAGCELIEVPRMPSDDLSACEYSAVFECSPGLHLPTVDRIEPELAHRLGAGAIFRGHGGDEIFCRNHPPLYVADLLRQHGASPGLLELLMHAAHTTGVTIWSVLAQAIWARLRPSYPSFFELLTQEPGDTLLHSHVLNELAADHSSAESCSLPPGRRWQMSLLCARRFTGGPFDLERDPDAISPLLSQPHVELCLRIPTWFQIANHTDRALARAAFSRDLPTEVVQRVGKGAAEHMASTILYNNLPYVRERLLDGLVVKSGIIDRARLESTLSPVPSLDALSSAPIFELLGAENWARAWRDFNALQSRTLSDRDSEANSSRPNRLA